MARTYESGDGAEDGETKPRPEAASRKGKGVMDAEEFQSLVGGALTDSVQFVDGELSPDRAAATRYYHGQPFGNEEEGRSQAVLTEVRDAVIGIVPSLMRIFFGSDHVVEFNPTRKDTVEQAQQATDYVRYVFEEDNAGFLHTLSVLKDGLIRKIGIFKWGWDDSDETTAISLQNLTMDELETLAADDDVTIVSRTPREVPSEEKFAYEKAKKLYEQAAQSGQQPAFPPPEPPPELWDAEITRTIKGGRLKVMSVPPEEFVFNREARTVESALLVAHRTRKTRGELIALGISEKDIDEYGGSGDSGGLAGTDNFEEQARREVAAMLGGGSSTANDPDLGEGNDKVVFAEAYVKVDYDGDGTPELRKAYAIGPQFHVVDHWACDERPFSVFTPDPEPHTLVGSSWADRTMDLQKIDSMLLRGTFDSLSASIYPRTVYLDGQANVQDILNTAIGAPIRERVAGAVRTFNHPFVGKEALGVLDFMKGVKEGRTGQDNGAVGLDSDALQSTAPDAVQAALTGSQQQAELVARVFAEMTFKPLFKGMLRQLVKNQPRERLVRLRGAYVEVNPRVWDASMDVSVNVALGRSFTSQKIQSLMGLLGKQEQYLQMLGPANPLVTLHQLSNTLRKLLRLNGHMATDEFINEVPPDWQPPPAPTPPDPLEAEKEMAREAHLKDLAIKRDELQFEKEKSEREFALKMRQQTLDALLRKFEIEAQFNTKMSLAQFDAEVNDEMREAELMLDVHQHAHEVNMATRAADAADAEAAATPAESAE